MGVVAVVRRVILSGRFRRGLPPSMTTTNDVQGGRFIPRGQSTSYFSFLSFFLCPMKKVAGFKTKTTRVKWDQGEMDQGQEGAFVVRSIYIYMGKKPNFLSLFLFLISLVVKKNGLAFLCVRPRRIIIHFFLFFYLLIFHSF